MRHLPRRGHPLSFRTKPALSSQRSPNKHLARMWMTGQDGGGQYMIFDALTEKKRLFLIGLALGAICQDGLKLTVVGKKVLSRLCELSDPDNPQIAFLELTDRARIEPRLRVAFHTLPTGSAILLICRSRHIYHGLGPYLAIEPSELRPYNWLQPDGNIS